MAVRNWLQNIFKPTEQPGEEPSLAQEAGLPDSWHPVDSAPINPAAAPNRPNSMQNFFSGPISPTLQHDKYFVDTQLGTYGVAKLPLVPLAASGQPSVGAAVQSGSTTTINNSVNAVAGGPNGAIQFNNGGALAGSALLKWDNVNNIVTVGGSVQITGSLIISGNITANIFNAITGFQIGGAAASGKYLRGNGTDFVSATLSGTDVLTGLVGVTYGGTGANLSATGGTSEVLLQTSVGGAVTVRQLTYADIGGSATSVPIWNTTAKTTTYSAVAGDMVLANSTGGGFTVTLPLASANTNLSIRVKKTSSDANNVTIGISGSDTIDGQSTQVISFQYTDIEMTSDGAGHWWIA